MPTSPGTTGTASRSPAPGWPTRPGATSRACGGNPHQTDGRRLRKDAKFVWGRGRTKTAAGRRRVTLTQGIRDQLLPRLSGRDPQAPVFTGKRGGILHNSNFTDRYLKPALAAARQDLALLRAAAPDAQALAKLPLEIPDIRPHVCRHTNAAWLHGHTRGRCSAPSGTC